MDAVSTWRGRRVLVTGCTEFLGGAVVRELLAGGATVVGLVRDRAAAGAFARHGLAGKVHVVHGRADDLFRVHSALAVHEVSAVFHLTDSGTPAVLEAVRRYDPRTPVVMARTSETLPPNPLPDPGSGDRSEAAGFVPPPRVGEGVRGWGLAVLGVARFGALFGGGRPFDRLPPDGPARDWVHVADAARACLRLAVAMPPAGLDVTFASGWVMTDRAMAAAIQAAFDGRPVFASGTTADHPLGWSPAVSFADALAETVDGYHSTRTRPASPPHRAAA